MKAAELFVNYLENEGVEYMFGVITFKNPDFVKYAESFGVKGYRVERAVDLLRTWNRRWPTTPWQSSTVPWTTRRT